MSSYLPANSNALRSSHFVAPSWLFDTFNRLQRMLTRWRNRRRFRREINGLSDHLLRDVGLDVEAHEENAAPFWSGHTPR